MKTYGKFVCFFVLISMLLTASGSAVWAQSEYTSENKKSDYVVENNMITAYLGNDVNVVVPAQIDGVEILGIDQNAFEESSAEKIIISEGIEVINMHAFKDCFNLKEVVIPDSMLLINDYAFSGCFQLNKPNINGEYTVVRPDAFETETTGIAFFSDEEKESEFVMSGNTLTAYNGTAADVEIPSIVDGVTVTTIGDGAFQGNTNITNVTIPDTVTVISKSAFSDCTSLVSVSFPGSLTTLGAKAFSRCSALKEITIPGTVTKWYEYVFEDCDALEKVVVGEGVTTIGTYTFYSCDALNDVTLPSTLKTINVWVFGFCTGLTSINIVDGVTLINSAAFYYCRNLNNVDVPDTVTTIGSHCFRACSKLSKLKLSENISQIPFRSLNGCSFETLTIPDKVTFIDREAFYQCSKLKYLNLPKNLQSIESLCFYSCLSLQWIKIYNNVSSISADTFNGCSNLTLYVEDGSYAENYAKTNSLSYKTILEPISAYSREDSIGVLTRINVPDFEKYNGFGVKYIPKDLYDNANYVTVSYDIAKLESPSITFFTQLDNIPDPAKDWEFVIIPFLSVNGEEEIVCSPKVLSISNTTLRDYE